MHVPLYETSTQTLNPDLTDMSSSRSIGLALALTLAVGALACDNEPLGPLPGDTKTEDQLTFVRFDPAFISQIPLQASFWAFRGRSARLIIRSNPSGPGPSGEKFLELELDDETLLRRPDGTLFAEGDSVLISVAVDPGGRFLFEFSPSGLQFNPVEPAELRIRYVLAQEDLNGDGTVDNRDLDFERLLAVWKRERSSDPWVRLLSLEIEEDELEADLAGFTGFALAN